MVSNGPSGWDGSLWHIAAIVGRISLKIALGNLLEIAKGLASIFTILDLRELPAIDPQMPLAPGSDIYFKRIDANSCDELLESGAFSHRNIANTRCRRSKCAAGHGRQYMLLPLNCMGHIRIPGVAFQDTGRDPLRPGTTGRVGSAESSQGYGRTR
jgi:hypothetical protein